MSWLEFHKTSERLAAEAEDATRRGNQSRAVELYIEAARAEERALAELDPAKTRTLGITAISAGAMYYKAGDLAAAEAFAYRWLSSESLPDFASNDLRLLLQSVWSEQARRRAGIGFAPGEIIVSISGGEIIEGGAPLDLIVEKVQTVQSLFYRTAELLRGLPHRTRGRPSREIQESVRPWLFQTAPGSYQFAVAVQEPAQQSLFRTGEPSSSDIATQFLRIVRASVEDPKEELPRVISDDTYRSTMLKLTRNLAPKGNRFTRLQLRAADGRQVELVPEMRNLVNEAIRTLEPEKVFLGEREVIKGTLRALHLDQDWIEVTSGDKHLRISGVGEAVDDVIGPMVNHPVTVQIHRDGNRLKFMDIERED